MDSLSAITRIYFGQSVRFTSEQLGAETNENKNFYRAIWELCSVLFDERINICMGLYRKFFNFGTEKTVFFCIIDDKKLLSIVKMRYAIEISYNDIKNQVF
jgi:hypothetical protein